jgi:hypothetical protein
LLEGALSGVVHNVLRKLPVGILDDSGFWRYMTMTHGLDFVAWRESRAFESGDFARYRIYIDGANSTECVLLRMFLRGQICRYNDDYELATAVRRGSDFWRSHILRVRTGSTPVVARALVRQQEARRMATGPLRDTARRLNRLWSNVVPIDYTEDEAVMLVAEFSTDG